jgi:hypothetical protein
VRSLKLFSCAFLRRITRSVPSPLLSSPLLPSSHVPLLRSPVSSSLQRALSVKCIPPLSKVLLQLMSHERSRGQEGGGRGGGGGAYRSPHVDTMRLVAVLNSFFNSHPANSPSETAPYSCAKTLLAQLLDCLGIDEVMKIMKTLKISPQSFIYRSLHSFLPSLLPSPHSPSSLPCSLLSLMDCSQTRWEIIQICGGQ